MGWARVDDNFHDHPKVDNLSLEAVGLWTLTLTWAHRHRRTMQRPGHIPDSRIKKVAGARAKRLSSELENAGLWIPNRDLGGCDIHDFAEYLPKERDADERAAAGRKGAASRWQRDGKPDGNLPPNSMASDGSRASARAFPSRPVPSPSTSSPELKAEAHVSSGADPEPSPQCSKHPDGPHHDEPCVTCKRVRETQERSEKDDELATQRAKAAAVARARDCTLCAGGWRLDSETPIKCDHQARKAI